MEGFIMMNRKSNNDIELSKREVQKPGISITENEQAVRNEQETEKKRIQQSIHAQVADKQTKLADKKLQASLKNSEKTGKERAAWERMSMSQHFHHDLPWTFGRHPKVIRDINQKLTEIKKKKEPTQNDLKELEALHTKAFADDSKIMKKYEKALSTLFWDIKNYRIEKNPNIEDVEKITRTLTKGP